MAKVRDLNIQGQKLVCNGCGMVYTKGLRTCPKCSRDLILKELNMREHGEYEVD